MTAQQSDGVSGSTISDMTAAEEREVVRRANQLCRRAEPHADSVPCAAHLHEAQRQLFGPVA